MRPETEYFLMRASEEAHRALTSAAPEASDAHETMALCYSARALALLDEEDRQSAQAGAGTRQVAC
jgi:hypothetical protein